jgi:hypothetical protein
MNATEIIGHSNGGIASLLDLVETTLRGVVSLGSQKPEHSIKKGWGAKDELDLGLIQRLGEEAFQIRGKPPLSPFEISLNKLSRISALNCSADRRFLADTRQLLRRPRIQVRGRSRRLNGQPGADQVLWRRRRGVAGRGGRRERAEEGGVTRSRTRINPIGVDHLADQHEAPGTTPAATAI